MKTAKEEFKHRFPETWESLTDKQKKHVIYVINGYALEQEHSTLSESKVVEVLIELQDELQAVDESPEAAECIAIKAKQICSLSVVDHYEEQKQHSHTATDLTEPTVDIAQVGEDRVERLMKAIIKLHPNLAMDIPEQEELYLAYHKCKSLQPAAVSEGEKCKECKFWIDGCFKDTDSADCFQYSMFQSLNQKGEGWIRVEDRLLEFAEWIYNNGPRGKWAYSEKELVKRFLETHPLPPNPEGGKDED